MLRWLRRSDDHSARIPGGLAVATQQVDRAHDRERELRQDQQRRDGWLEAHAHLGPQYRQVVRTLAWQRRATGVAVEQERPGYVLEALGPVPESTRGKRAWRHAAAEIEHYRRTYRITHPDRTHERQPTSERTSQPRPHEQGRPARPGAGRRLAPAGRSTPWPAPRPWPFDDDGRRPSGSVRPLSQADLQAIFAHLGDDPDQLLAGADADRPVVAVRVRASVGRQDGSAQGRWRRMWVAE